MKDNPTPREYLLSKIDKAIQITTDLHQSLQGIYFKLESKEYSIKKARQEALATTRLFRQLLPKGVGFDY